jgi:4-hydroxybenzoate polyprenyltransferase
LKIPTVALINPTHDTAIAGDQPDQGGGVLFVDLDGTLLSSDVFAESLLLAVKRNPLVLLLLPFWLLLGRAGAKRRLAECAVPDAAHLPYNTEVVDFLRAQKASGTRLVLATASDAKAADSIAAELDLFDAVLASDGQKNLKGRTKLAAIEEYCREHGFSRFGYVGDSSADLPIWRSAADSYLVGRANRFEAALASSGRSVRSLSPGRPALKQLVRGLRPQQWAKNLLLFAPLALAHQFTTAAHLLAVSVAFVAFCACASAVYILNDLFDLEADRLHPTKRSRPFASGDLPIAYGPLLVAGAMALAFGLSWALLPLGFTASLLVYLVINALYSLWLKRKVGIDVILLASLYALRVVAGGVAADVPVSEWLLVFSMFMFLSLAFVKRYTELARGADEGMEMPAGRGYQASDLSLIESVGPSSGYLAVLVFALYINSEHTRQLYPHTHVLWLICPLMLYWITRLWFLAKRRAMCEDPLVYALKDRISLGIGAATIALVALAAWGPL